MATGVGADNTTANLNFKLADSLKFNGDDYSNPSASSSNYSNYKTGGFYNVSGRSNGALGLGKVLIYTGLIYVGYWLYKRMKRG